MVFSIIKKKYKEHSKHSIQDIKKMQHIHKKDLIQPRQGGEINPEYFKMYGGKNLNLTERDVKVLEKKGMGKRALQTFQNQYNGNKNI